MAQAQTARPEIEAALARLEGVDHINILCVPDQGRDVSIAATMISQCERRGDRFAVLQGAAGWTTPNEFQSSIPPSGLGAVYHPSIRVRGPGLSDTCFVPPSGHVAGVYARVDASRGVHTAPANRVVRGLALSETGSPLSQQVACEQQEVFNAANVNIIRDFRMQGRGSRQPIRTDEAIIRDCCDEVMPGPARTVLASVESTARSNTMGSKRPSSVRSPS
jgi:phage tail sheath protein FI